MHNVVGAQFGLLLLLLFSSRTKSVSNYFFPCKNPLLSCKWTLQNHCNSAVLVSPFSSHNGLSQPLKCICRFGSSFIIWNVPQCRFKNSSSLIVPSLGNYVWKNASSESIIYVICSNSLPISFWSLECTVGQRIFTYLNLLGRAMEVSDTR